MTTLLDRFRRADDTLVSLTRSDDAATYRTTIMPAHDDESVAYEGPDQDVARLAFETAKRCWVDEIGESAYASIQELVEALDRECPKCEGSGDAPDDVDECPACDGEGERPDEDLDEARQTIEEDALSVQVRSDWYTPGDPPNNPGEYELLLSTGGPAVRIVGELSEHGEPTSARLQVQDWFKPWTEYAGGADSYVDEDVLRTYASCFYYGEG